AQLPDPNGAHRACPSSPRKPPAEWTAACGDRMASRMGTAQGAGATPRGLDGGRSAVLQRHQPGDDVALLVLEEAVGGHREMVLVEEAHEEDLVVTRAPDDLLEGRCHVGALRLTGMDVTQPAPLLDDGRAARRRIGRGLAGQKEPGCEENCRVNRGSPRYPPNPHDRGPPCFRHPYNRAGGDATATIRCNGPCPSSGNGVIASRPS